MHVREKPHRKVTGPQPQHRHAIRDYACDCTAREQRDLREQRVRGTPREAVRRSLRDTPCECTARIGQLDHGDRAVGRNGGVPHVPDNAYYGCGDTTNEPEVSTEHGQRFAQIDEYRLQLLRGGQRAGGPSARRRREDLGGVWHVVGHLMA